jgi:AraC family transcriptional regulator
MDILERLNGVIGYIEEHLTDGEALSPAEVAKAALMPAAQFYRLFPYIANVTVGEYIRRRRLTLAAGELLSTDIKIIDCALKYGYESPDAFGRAFAALHGVPPSAVRKPGVRISAFPRLSFSIKIKGDQSMNYEIKKKEAFAVVGKKITVRDGEQETGAISNFWGKSTGESWFRELCGMCRTDLGVMGVCANIDSEGTFEYYIAVEKTEAAKTEGFETLDVPASEWACFESVGPMPHAIQDVWKYVMTEWLPSSGYRRAGEEIPDVEVYPDADMPKADYNYELWYPVVKE